MLSIRWNGKDSFADFGATIKSYKHGFPKKNNYTLQVPYSSAVIDFSQLHEESYSTREISYVFNIIGKNIADMDHKITEFSNWIMAGNKFQALYDISKRYYFMAKCLSCAPSTKNNVCELSVTFIAEPYRISRDYGKPTWDDFCFDTDYLNAAKYPANDGSTTYIFYNYGLNPICPKIIYNKENSGDNCTIYFKDNMYRVYKTQTFNDLIFDVGENTFEVIGNGTIKFTATEKVI